MLRVSRALELRIGLQAELQGGDPLGPPCALRALFPCVASTLRGQRCCKAFGRAFGRALAGLRMELLAELLQAKTPKIPKYVFLNTYSLIVIIDIYNMRIVGLLTKILTEFILLKESTAVTKAPYLSWA